MPPKNCTCSTCLSLIAIPGSMSSPTPQKYNTEPYSTQDSSSQVPPDMVSPTTGAHWCGGTDWSMAEKKCHGTPGHQTWDRRLVKHVDVHLQNGDLNDLNKSGDFEGDGIGQWIHKHSYWILLDHQATVRWTWNMQTNYICVKTSQGFWPCSTHIYIYLFIYLLLYIYTYLCVCVSSV